MQDGGGAAYLDYVESTVGIDAFINVQVDRTAAASVPGGCTTACFPRTLTLEIGYHQRTERLKRIIFVKLIYDDFDKDPTVTSYKLKLCTWAQHTIHITHTSAHSPTSHLPHSRCLCLCVAVQRTSPWTTRS